jgi:two-component system LytT family response regulator
MRILILEDEPLIADNLERMVLKLHSDWQIIGKIPSLREAETFINQGHPIDMILADIQLSDGVSFRILEKLVEPIPIIFTTAYDEFALRAFRLHSIDYLLKPVEEADLLNALNKFQLIKAKFNNAHFNEDFKVVLSETQKKNERKKRFLVFSGKSIVPILSSEIAYFIKQEIIFLIDISGKQYVTEYRSLDEIQELTDEKVFFRANRQYLVNIDVIERFETDYLGKLHLNLNIQESIDITVSKDKAAEFKRWIEQ